MGKAAALDRDDSARANEVTTGNEPVEPKTKRGAKARSARKASAVKYRRRTIELHPEIEVMLDRMQQELRLRSHTEVMQKAIQLLAVMLGEDKGERRKIFIERKDGKLQELLII